MALGTAHSERHEARVSGCERIRMGRATEMIPVRAVLLKRSALGGGRPSSVGAGENFVGIAGVGRAGQTKSFSLENKCGSCRPGRRTGRRPSRRRPCRLWPPKRAEPAVWREAVRAGESAWGCTMNGRMGGHFWGRVGTQIALIHSLGVVARHRRGWPMKDTCCDVDVTNWGFAPKVSCEWMPILESRGSASPCLRRKDGGLTKT